MRLRLLTVLFVITVFGSVSFSAKSEEGTRLRRFAATPAQTPAPPSQVQPAHAQEQTAEQVYKNIQVLKGVPASQIQPTMAFITGSLVALQPLPQDERLRATKAQQTARRMMRMVLDINRANFDGAAAVSCNTCHRGQTRPQSVPALGQSLWLPAAAAGAKADAAAALPSVEQILDNYVRALGGREALLRVKSRVLKGSRVGADGVLVPEEVQRAPTSSRRDHTRRSFSARVRRATGWARTSGGATSEGGAGQACARAEFYRRSVADCTRA